MSDYIHKIYPTQCDPKDFWGQIKRTVNGRPVPEEQIQMIIDSIFQSLDMNSTDTLLDLGCGNGALAERLFSKMKAYRGVDFSDYLIEVAKNNFEKFPDYTFEVAEMLAFLRADKLSHLPTKVLIYGCFSYLSRDSSKEVLALLFSKYLNVQKVFIGNLPDKAKSEDFFKDRPQLNLDDPQSPIGVWRTVQEFKALAESVGWTAVVHFMPSSFYSAHYRYDIILQRGENG